MGRLLPCLLGRPRDLLVEPVVADHLPAARPGFSGGDAARDVPGTLALLRAQGAEPLPWTEDSDLLLTPWPEPGEQTGWLLELLSGLPPAYPVALYEREVPLLPNLVVGAGEEPLGDPRAGLRAHRSALRHLGRGGAEALALLPAKRAALLLRGSPLAMGRPGAGRSLQNRRFLAHALDHQRSLLQLHGLPERLLGPVDRVLVLAPHFDDEVLLCGQAVLDARAAGAEVCIAWMTDGGAAGSVRRSEAGAAAAALGVERLEFLGAPETRLGRRGPWTARLRRLLTEFRPQRVHLPWWGDGHVDHYETNRVLLAAWPAALAGAEIAAGAFWTPLPSGTLLPVGPGKEAALRCHASQLAEVDYARAAAGLERWNARRLDGVERAELHLVLPAEDYWRRFRRSGAGRRLYLRRGA